MTKAQRRAVKKMQAGLRRWKREQNPRARRRSKKNPHRARRRNAQPGVLAVGVEAYSRHAPKKRKTKKNPSRARRRRNAPMAHRRHHGRRGPIILINSSKRGSKGHHRRRRNPAGGMGAALRQVMAALIPAAIAGGGMGFVDAQFLGDLPIIARMLIKLVAAGGTGALLRKHPPQAYAAMGAILGTTVYEAGIRAGGGVITTTKSQGMKQLAAMAAEDRSSMGLLQREFAGMGLLTQAQGMAGLGAPANTGAHHAEPDLGGGRTRSDDDLARRIAADWGDWGREANY